MVYRLQPRILPLYNFARRIPVVSIAQSFPPFVSSLHRPYFSTLSEGITSTTTVNEDSWSFKSAMTEVHELCITNLGPFLRKNQLTNFLKENNINFVSVDKPKNVAFGFVRFATSAERDAAFNEIGKLEMKGRKLAVRAVMPKRLKQVAWEQKESKRGSRDQKNPKDRGVKDVHVPKSIHELTTPWYDRPYEEQLYLKQREISNALCRMTNRILDECDRRIRECTSAQRVLGTKREREDDAQGQNEVDNRMLRLEDRFTTPSWVEEVSKQHTKRVCELLPIVPSPVTVGYRNKGQFTIGRDEHGEPCVGFRLGGFSESGVVIASPKGSVHLPPAMLRVADAVTEFVKRSPLPVYDMITHVGIWRQLTVRVMNQGKEVMVEMMSYPVTDEMEQEYARLKSEYDAASSAYQEALAKAEASAAEAAELVGDAEMDASAAITEDSKAESAAASQEATTPCPPEFKYKAFQRPPTVAMYKAELDRFVKAMQALEGVRCVETYKEVTRAASPVASITTTTAGSEPASDSTATATSDSTFTPVEYKTTTLENTVATVSVYLQEYTGLSTPDTNHPRAHLAGPATIREEISGMRFNVSPGAFFQVNTPAADQLYRLARAMSVAGVDGAKVMLGSSSSEVKSLEDSETTNAANANTTASKEDSLLARASFVPSTFHAQHNPNVDQRMVLLDVCCGTGTIGIVCSPYAERVLGIDTAADGIEDARKNVLLNDLNLVDVVPVEGGGYRLVPATKKEQTPPPSSSPPPTPPTSLTFVCNKAEAVLRELLPYFLPAGASQQPLVAIVDPPRGGLHPDVIRALRTSPAVQRVVYVSCNPTGTLIEDVMRFCVPQGGSRVSYARGPPFRPVLAVPLDLFPHTPHCELVILFERATL